MAKEQTILDRLNKVFGDSIVWTSDVRKEVEPISTGSISLDASLGIGGIPRGKITVFYGAEGTSKTTLCLSIANNAININKTKVVYIDTENMLDPNYVEKVVGTCDPNLITVAQPQTAEEAFMIAEAAIESGEYGLVVIDSIASLAPAKEQEGDFDEASNFAQASRLLGSFLRRKIWSIRTNNVAMLFTNQVRDTVGAYTKSYSMPGGHAIKHGAASIVFLSKADELKRDKKVIGQNIKFTTKKNKLFHPNIGYQFPLIYGEGVDRYRDMLSFCGNIGVIDRTGAYYRFGDIQLGRGAEEVYEFLGSNPDVVAEIRKASIAKVIGLHSSDANIEDELVDETIDNLDE